MFTDVFSRLKDFEKLSVGYDRLFDRVAAIQNQAIKMATNYPPCNVKKVDDNKYTIEMAVAGFGEQDIDIELDGSKLVIKGNIKREESEDENSWPQVIYQGLAMRPFTRSFELADRIEVQGAQMINGILKIVLETIVPEENKPTKIEINKNVKGE